MQWISLHRAALLGAAFSATCACTRSDTSSPLAEAGPPAPVGIGSPLPPPTGSIDHRPIWMRDSGTRYGLIQPMPSAPSLADFADGGPPPPPLVTRQPDWDLSRDDPARDYALRYAFFTRRYPDGLDCADFGPGDWSGARRRVVVTTPAACTGGGTVRDVFLVDVAGDHLTVDDKSKRNPLGRWPDGSDPEGPAATEVRQVGDMRKWKSPLKDAVIAQGLTPMRMQAYGRGTYPVISVAAWRAPFVLNAPPDALQPLADAMCTANEGMPLAFVAGFDRSHVLRIRCPASTRWDLFAPDPKAKP